MNRPYLRATLAIMGSVALSSCTAIVAEQIYIGQAERSLVEYFRSNLSEEWRPGDSDRRSQLRQGQQDEFEVSVGAGESVGVLGGCDDDCGALTMQLVDDTGFPVASITESTRHPFVSYQASEPGVYTVQVAMAECTSEPCFASYWVMRNPSPEMQNLYEYYSQTLESEWAGIGPLQRGDLDRLSPERRPQRFLGGQEASVIAACDPNCAQLSIQVLDSDGFPLPNLALDGDDQRLTLQFAVESSGDYRVDIGMGDCTAPQCSFAYWILERRSGAATDER